MSHQFVLSGIHHEPFASLFDLSEEALVEHGAIRCIADRPMGFPCRVSLEDAAVGDELLLLPFQHQPSNSPYRASGPIFVRRGVARSVLAAGVVPAYVSQRLISVRAYDRDDMMTDAEVVDGSAVAATLALVFREENVSYVHLHNASRGCFSCVARRA